MPASHSFSIFENSGLKAIPVIASFDSLGSITPLYVRLNGISFQVHTSSRLHSPSAQYRFRCEIVDHGQVKHIILTYHIRESAWSISRE